LQTHLLPIFLPYGVGVGKINLSKSTFLVLFLAVGFMVGMSFTSVYAGIPWETADIANDAITSEKIKNRQVKGTDIKGNTINSGKIKDGTITSADIATDAVKSLEIKNGAVGTGELALDAVTTSRILDNTISIFDIGANAVGSDEIQAGAVGTSEIMNFAITDSDLAPGLAVPIGTILDWFCNSPCTVPSGYAIANGQLINDPASPFNGQNIPDLTKKFVRGVTDVNDVGQTGGSTMHNHAITDPDHQHGSAGSHTHLTDTKEGHSHTTSLESHNHLTTDTFGQKMALIGTTDVADDHHNHGISINFHSHSTSNEPEHFHTTENSLSHTHPLAQTGITVDGNNNEPPYVGLVKIIRIK